MAWYSFLTGFLTSPKAIENASSAGKSIVEGIVDGLDHITLTEEEKVKYTANGMQTVLKFWETIANENTEQSRARRALALMTFKVYFTLLLLAVIIFPWNPGYSSFILTVVASITFIISAITLIYFGPHQISKVWKKNENKNVEGKNES